MQTKNHYYCTMTLLSFLLFFQFLGKILFPIFPHLGLVAHGGLPAVADHRGLDELGVFKEFFQLVLVIGQVLEQGGIWVRPAGMWNEHVERDGYSGPRFAYIGE